VADNNNDTQGEARKLWRFALRGGRYRIVNRDIKPANLRPDKRNPRQQRLRAETQRHE
jgi:hypothetical protein